MYHGRSTANPEKRRGCEFTEIAKVRRFEGKYEVRGERICKSWKGRRTTSGKHASSTSSVSATPDEPDFTVGSLGPNNLQGARQRHSVGRLVIPRQRILGGCAPVHDRVGRCEAISRDRRCRTGRSVGSRDAELGREPRDVSTRSRQGVVNLW